MLALLALALGAPGAAAFVIQISTWCSLSPSGSLLYPNASLALDSTQMVCADFGDPPRAVPCPGGPMGGPLGAIAAALIEELNRDPRWQRRLRQRRRLCQDLPRKVWPPLMAPPQLRIVPQASALLCHAWAFAPAQLTLGWLQNGDPLGPPENSGAILGPPGNFGDIWGPPGVQSPSFPVGDGTFRTQLSLELPPGSGDTFGCWARHPSLREPLIVTWAPGMSRALWLRVGVAALVLLSGLLLLLFGLRRFLAPPPAPGYAPLPGDTYAGSI